MLVYLKNELYIEKHLYQHIYAWITAKVHNSFFFF